MDIEDRIKQELTNTPTSTSELAERLGVSRVYVSQKLSKMLKKGVVEKQRSGKSVIYSLKTGKTIFELVFHPDVLSESELLMRVRENRVFRQEVPENVRSIFEYAFPEMMNNAIEHAKSEKIWTKVEVASGVLHFIVRDFGIGVFRNVKEKFGLDTEIDAITEIMKGKNTTEPRAHTGMGIFFTSKIADRLKIKSFGLDFLVDNTLPDVFVKNTEPLLEGTEVSFEIALNSQKKVSQIFQSFSIDPEEGDFDKTEIKVKLYKYGTIYVSRSQARMMLARLDKFKRVILDFSGVEDIGQAFADEVFRVYKLAHPEVEIEYRNASSAVEFMIKLAKNGLEI